MHKIRFIMAATLAVALSAAPQALRAQEDPVVARVNGEPLYQSDLMKAAQTLPPQYQANLQQLLPMLLERLIDLELVGMAGREAGLAADEEVKRRLVEAETEVIREVYLERMIVEKVTEDLSLIHI